MEFAVGDASREAFPENDANIMEMIAMQRPSQLPSELTKGQLTFHIAQRSTIPTALVPSHLMLFKDL